MSDEFVTDLAVVLGIGAYNPAVGRLETPARDAEAIASLLEDQFGYDVILRRDEEATLAGLRTLLHDELPKRAPAGSRLLFYFAGHGVAVDSTELEGPQGYLVPQDAAGADSHLSMRELYEALAALPCRHLLVVLDCCFAGAFRWASWRPAYIPDEVLYEERYRHWVRHPARWTLASAAHDEYAPDTLDRRRGPQSPYSPFATALLEGLAGEADTRPKGGDGIITLAELYAYVQDRVAPFQSPLLSPLPGQTRGEFVFRDLRRERSLVSAEQMVRLDESHNPYRDLKPHGVGDAELLFGREDFTRRLIRHVRRNRLTLLAGPSGCGKSSLVQAGLISRLRTRRPRRPEVGWQVPEPLQVMGDPLAALHGALAAAGGPAPPSAAELRDNREAVQAWAAAWRAFHPCERLLLIVDQAEELVTRVPLSGTEKPGELPATSTSFLSCLHTLLETGAGRLRALLAVRSDYEADLHGGPLAPLQGVGSLTVPPLALEELRQMIEGPFGRKALYFDDPRLVDRLADEMVGMPGGLPLLSCMLSRLYLAYLRHGRGDRLLTALDLEEIDGKPAARAHSPVAEGLLRVLREVANRMVGELPDEAHEETLWRILLRLVDRAGDQTTRRQVSLRELEYPEDQENRRAAEVLERLVAGARLLVRDRDRGAASQGRNAVVELAHDKLLEAWPGLEQRVKESRNLLPDHRRLTRAATAWITGTGSPRGELRRRRDLDLRLLKAIEASGLPADWLNRDETDYLAAARIERRRRTLQLWAVTVTTLVGVLALFATTWRPAINELGFLELRPGPKWLAPLNFGSWRRRVETDFSSVDLVDRDEEPEVRAQLQDEAGLYPWPGRNRAGLRRWIDRVLNGWLRREVALRWKVRLDFPEIGRELLTTQRAGGGGPGALRAPLLKERKTFTDESATELAAEYALLRPDLPLLDAWPRQWTELDYGTSCNRPGPSERNLEMAELYLWGAPPEQAAAWLRGLALTARSSDQVGFDQLFRLVESFKTNQLSWEKDHRANPGRTDDRRPSPPEVAALADIAEAVVVRRIDTGKPAVPDAARLRLLSDLPGCSGWVVPMLARLGPLGDPGVVRNWGSSLSQSNQGLDLLRSLSEYGLLTGADLEKELRSRGFGRDDLSSKKAMEEVGDWLETVARNQPLPSSAVDSLLRFAETSLRKEDTASAYSALKPLAWSAPNLSEAQRRALPALFRSLSPVPPMNRSEMELWGILGARSMTNTKILSDVLGPVATADLNEIPRVFFSREDRDESSTITTLHTGLGLNDLLAIARIVLGLPKTDRMHRSPATLHFLRQAAHDGLRVGVPARRLDDVFVAIADLATQLEPGRFGPASIQRLLWESNDAIDRSIVVYSGQAALRRAAGRQQADALAQLRDRWKKEKEPEVKYALGTLIIEVERARRLHEALRSIGRAAG